MGGELLLIPKGLTRHWKASAVLHCLRAFPVFFIGILIRTNKLRPNTILEVRGNDSKIDAQELLSHYLLRPKVKGLVRGLIFKLAGAVAWTTLPPRGSDAGAGMARNRPCNCF